MIVELKNKKEELENYLNGISVLLDSCSEAETAELLEDFKEYFFVEKRWEVETDKEIKELVEISFNGEVMETLETKIAVTREDVRNGIYSSRENICIAIDGEEVMEMAVGHDE